MQQVSHLTDDRDHAQNIIPMLVPLFKSECHIFTHRGNHILFDVATGGFFQIDNVTCDLINQCTGHTLKGLMNLLQDLYTEKEILSAFKELFDAGILSDVPPERPSPFIPPDRLEIVHVELDITSDTLDDNPRQQDVCYMDELVALKAIDLLLKESGRIRQCHLSFQGEPLLNAPLVEKVIYLAQKKARCLGKDISFEIVTNGRLLNEELFNRLQNQHVNIMIKFDGEEHRPLFQGNGPYSLSSKGMQQHILKQNVPVQLKSKTQHNIFDLSSKICQGIDQYPTVERISFIFDALTSETDLPQAQTALENLAAYVTQHVLNGESAWIENFEDYIFQVANQKAFFYHCGTGVRSIAIAPDGIIYTDSQQTVAIGDIWKGIDRKKQKAWIQSTLVENMEGCATCWARHLCGGTCRTSVKTEMSSDMVSIQCALTQRTYELAMAACLDISDRDAACLHRRYAEQN
jgi:uncharacterized protein